MRKLDTGLATYWLLTVTAWMSVNILVAVGAVAMLFALMANWTWHGLFIELAGLARHFLDAPIAARRDFEGLATKLLIVAILITSLARFRVLLLALAVADRREIYA